MTRFRRKRAMNGNRVTGCDQAFDRGVVGQTQFALEGLRQLVMFIIVQSDVESLHAARDGLTDATTRHDADLHSFHVIGALEQSAMSQAPSCAGM